MKGSLLYQGTIINYLVQYLPEVERFIVGVVVIKEPHGLLLMQWQILATGSGAPLVAAVMGTCTHFCLVLPKMIADGT